MIVRVGLMVLIMQDCFLRPMDDRVEVLKNAHGCSLTVLSANGREHGWKMHTCVPPVRTARVHGP